MIRTRRGIALALIAAMVWPYGLAASPAKEPSTAVTCLLLAHPGVTDGDAEQVMLALGRSLKKNPHLNVKDAAKLLADYAGEIPAEAIGAARAAAEEGMQAMLELEFPKAVKKLTQGIELLEQVLRFIKKNELADAMMALAVTHLASGDKKQAKQVFLRLLTWREGMSYDTEKYPPKYLEVFEEAKREVKKRPRGSIEVRSTPEGAQAYVDGKFVGTTPVSAEGLLVGTHYVTLKKEGFQKLVLRVEVNPKKEEVVHAELRRSEKYKLLQDSLERAKNAVDSEVADPAMVDLRAFLFVDQVVFVRLAPAGPQRVHAELFLFDLRPKRRLSVVRRDIELASLDSAMQSATENLYLNVPYDGSLPPPPEEKPPETPKRRPFYLRWWFWTAVGVTALAIVIPAAVVPSEKGAPEPFRPIVITTY